MNGTTVNGDTMGLSNSQLDTALTYLWRLRIYHFRECISPGSTKHPAKPTLTPKQWARADKLFETSLTKMQKSLVLPPVFTPTQTHIAGAIMLMFDVMGSEAHTSVYADVEGIIANGLTQVNGHYGEVPSRHTIATVLYAFEETGAIKYIRGGSGVRSTLTLVDLQFLYDLGVRSPAVLSYSLPSSIEQDNRSTKEERGQSLRSLPHCVPIVQFRSFGGLLAELYVRSPPRWKREVTKTFKHHLKEQGLTVIEQYDDEPSYGPHGPYYGKQWGVMCGDDVEDVAALEVAVMRTCRQLKDDAYHAQQNRLDQQREKDRDMVQGVFANLRELRLANEARQRLAGTWSGMTPEVHAAMRAGDLSGIKRCGCPLHAEAA